MPTKAEIKAAKHKIKLKIRTGDKVLIVAGKDKGQQGIVAAVSREKMKALVVQEDVENPGNYVPLNAATKHQKAKFQGERSARFQKPMPIHLSNLKVIDPSTGEPTRIGRRVEGDKIVRYAKKSGVTIIDTPNVETKE
jgi:large subunit ribosomal protein L24